MKSHILLFLILFAASLSCRGQGSWEQMKDFTGPGRYAAAGFSLNGKGYLLTGYIETGPVLMQDTWEYNPVADKWTQKADFPGNRRWYAASFTIGGKGYITTGSGSGTMNDLWEYDPLSDKWTRKSDFPGSNRNWAISFSIG